MILHYILHSFLYFCPEMNTFGVAIGVLLAYTRMLAISFARFNNFFDTPQGVVKHHW